jgi:hypothetical protein
MPRRRPRASYVRRGIDPGVLPEIPTADRTDEGTPGYPMERYPRSSHGEHACCGVTFTNSALHTGQDTSSVAADMG